MVQPAGTPGIGGSFLMMLIRDLKFTGRATTISSVWGKLGGTD